MYIHMVMCAYIIYTHIHIYSYIYLALCAHARWTEDNLVFEAGLSVCAVAHEHGTSPVSTAISPYEGWDPCVTPALPFTWVLEIKLSSSA